MVLNMIMAFVIACVATAIITPFTIRLAFKVGAVDIPKDERKIHSKAMPRIGGLAFISGFIISTFIMFVCCEIDKTINLVDVNLLGFYAGAFIIVVTRTYGRYKRTKAYC